MKVEEILNLWENDSKIDQTNLSKESLNIAKLHHKYLCILMNEKLILKRYEFEFKELSLEKYEFYILGPNEDQIKKGWKLPSQGKILKNEVSIYINGDKELNNLQTKISLQQDKVKALESIINTINNRSYHIRDAIDNNKFLAGVN